MRNALLLSFLLVAPVGLIAQGASSPAPPAQTPAQPRQPAARPRPRAAQPAPARTGMAITVTNGAGVTLPNVHVEVSGPMARNGDTDASGQINFPGLAAGTYMLRFTGDDVVAFEREATLTAGRVAQLQISLTPAQAKPVAPPPAPAKPVIGPAGSAQWGSLPDLAKKAQQSSKEPRREIMIACSGNERSMLVLLSEDQPQRLYQDAESVYYVIDGQGAIKIGDREGAVGSGSFSSVPHGMPFSITRRGNKPLVMLWVLSGVPCEEAR